jgi:heptosyltransferase-1
MQLKRILIVKLGSIGDVVHTLPALAALKTAFPECQVDWLVERKSSIILRNNPLLHQVIEVDTQRWRESWANPGVWGAIRDRFSYLRHQHYDLAMDFQGLWKSAAFSYFSGARRVIGFGKQWLREPGCRILYHEAIVVRPGIQHVIDIYNELPQRLGAPAKGYHFDFCVSQDDETYISANLSAHGVREFVILNPGGGWETKTWNSENFGQLHLKLREATRFQSVITWGPGEEQLVDQLVGSCREAPPVVFPTTIPQFIALARRASLFVGGDTGPMHLAAACQTPIVGVFGPTDPKRNGPFSPDDLVISHEVPCGPCYKRSCAKYGKQCLRLVTVDEVFQSVLLRLGLAS